MSTIVYT